MYQHHGLYESRPRSVTIKLGGKRTHLVQDDEYRDKEMDDLDSVPKTREILMMRSVC